MGSSASITTILRSTANSAGAVKDKANRIVAESKGTGAERVSQLTGDTIKTLQDQINTLRGLLGSLATIVQGGSGSSFTISILDVALVTATTTNIVPVTTAPADGEALLVVTTQDATGGGLITWDASFKGITSDDNDETATVLSSYFFIGRGGFWTIAAFPRLGFAP